ncbi:MAG: hypothetical protein IKA31_02950 [Clostridia bacterium]|nr:hypothetical protein [Clostridia bacterium]MBR4003210.1 hypothetical protein [Clostridia bacterium]
MSKIQKCLLPLFLVFVFIFCLTGCAENEDLPADKWLEVKEATGYTYSSTENRDYWVDAKSKGFTTEKISNDKEWDTPSLRYRSIVLDVKKSCTVLGMAFELKTEAIEGFNIWVEVQLYKTVSFPSNWEELTEEAKMLWEKENRIKDKQFDSIYIGKNPDAVSFSFDTEQTKLDSSYQIRIYFSTTNPNISDEEQGGVGENIDYLKNFMVDNFIVLTEGAE